VSTIDKPACTGTRKDGKPCRSTILADNGRCAYHGGVPPDEIAERQRRGGLAWGEARRQLARSGRDRMREQFEEDEEAYNKLRAAYVEGLEATTADGEPDYRARLHAADSFLAQIYGKPVQPTEERGQPLVVVRPPRSFDSDSSTSELPENVRELRSPA
jgi:hypothetical protein